MPRHKHVPPPSPTRVYARKMGYLTAIAAAAIILVGLYATGNYLPESDIWGGLPFVPPAVGFLTYTLIRGTTPIPTANIISALRPPDTDDESDES